MIGGSIACRVSLAPEYAGKKFYCDFCGEFFDDRDNPPCDAAPSQEVVEEPTVEAAEVQETPAAVDEVPAAAETPEEFAADVTEPLRVEIRKSGKKKRF